MKFSDPAPYSKDTNQFLLLTNLKSVYETPIAQSAAEKETSGKRAEPIKFD